MTTSMKDGLVVSYRNSTSNHNSRYYKYFLFQLYLIEILHQTTTSRTPRSHSLGLYLIEILHQTTTTAKESISTSTLYLIEILHQTTTMISAIALRRRLYLIEILHQTTTWDSHFCNRRKLYLIEILHQTTTRSRCSLFCYSCILSKFYIKPQLRLERELSCCVVSYRNSTSNHNNPRYLPNRKNVVSYRNSTSNHNSADFFDNTLVLYLIEILHQTTTLQ